MAFPVVDGQRIPNGYQQLTGLSSAQSLTIPAGTRLAIFQAEAQNVRWRDDGINPTSSVGMLMQPGDVFIYTGMFTGATIKFIEVTASAKVNVSYYK